VRAGVLLALAAGLVVAGSVAALYQRDIAAARARIATGAQVAQTACGPIQYAEAGQGRPLLVIHGAGGGFDQGLDFLDGAIPPGMRVISVSRFGYLGTPLPADASAPAQARAHACLLDTLGIERVAVLGGSAGATSAMQFAILHPGRTTHLILLVPAAFVPRADGSPPLTAPAATQAMFDTALRWDFLFWAFVRAAPGIVTEALLATPPAVVEAAGADEQARVRRVMEHILPISPRREGLLNDAKVTSSLARYDLERIAAPTLIVSAPDDLFGTLDGARYTARCIPGARLVEYPSGGHLLVGHAAKQAKLFAEFLGASPP
jgi:2-hydroxy-6-oxonona-2,4-dienedioate hydrolase